MRENNQKNNNLNRNIIFNQHTYLKGYRNQVIKSGKPVIPESFTWDDFEFNDQHQLVKFNDYGIDKFTVTHIITISKIIGFCHIFNIQKII